MHAPFSFVLNIRGPDGAEIRGVIIDRDGLEVARLSRHGLPGHAELFVGALNAAYCEVAS